ncbi:MAG: hypothetical protein HY094_00710 [Candidatus Melainabacteria bacterium]|nr:hypothetical protein [Candidatus Melainabacteria bacterium]
MLSDFEKREMILDASDKNRMKDFRLLRKDVGKISFEEYLTFLNDIQKVFKPFKISTRKTKTDLNKL